MLRDNLAGCGWWLIMAMVGNFRFITIVNAAAKYLVDEYIYRISHTETIPRVNPTYTL